MRNPAPSVDAPASVSQLPGAAVPTAAGSELTQGVLVGFCVDGKSDFLSVCWSASERGHVGLNRYQLITRTLFTSVMSLRETPRGNTVLSDQEVQH